ncbi:hypothetical protein [Burkholderia cepacia]|uniref:hypothetical protein n=1 Tax=Burkholderia cepacia TaxID=292 RepID=UPI001CF1B5F3|nr:hypothetical protein [Burkholderia cepacia]MCA8079943.1 hypothetical protein [Burkholderia cepacia]
MNKTPRSAKQLHDKLLTLIARAGEARTASIAKYGEAADDVTLIPFLAGTLRNSYPELATALANAAGMEYLNDSYEAPIK